MQEIRSTARSELQNRLAIENVAKTHKVNFDEDDNDRSVKAKILTKLNPSIKLDGKSDDYIDSAYDIAMTYEADKTKKVSGQLGRMDKRDDKGTNDDGVPAAMSSRDEMLRRMRGEKTETAA